MPRQPRPRAAAAASLLAALSAAGCSYVARQATVAYMAVESALSEDWVEITLDRSFVEAYKNRVTITASFTVDEAMEKALTKVLDGDLHFAGRAPEVKLPVVGEIVNAGEVDAAVALVQRAESTHAPVRVSGAWRLWPEHARRKKQEQGDSIAPIESWNPDHSFEIHPVTRIGGVDLLPTLHPVDDFRPGNAERTFGIYGRATCQIHVTRRTVRLVTPTGLYNDVHFVMQLGDQRPVVARDGRIVTGSAYSLKGELLVEGLRMAFVKGSAPERLLRQLQPGGRMHVYGIPRVDLAEVSRRARTAHGDSATVSGTLPFEIVVIGVYPEGE